MPEDATTPVDRTAIYPYPASHTGVDDYDHADYVEDSLDVGAVMDTLATLAANGLTDEPMLTEFGKRMASLMFHSGMDMSKAKAKAAAELFPQSWSLQQKADALGMTKGAFFDLQGSAATATKDAQRLHYMTFDVPMNLVLDETLAAEPPADYETRYVLLEVVAPRTEADEVDTYTRRGPDTQHRPPEPQYALVTETYAPSNYDPDAPPADRGFSPFQDMTLEWFMDGAEVVDALYEDQYFDTEERAEYWYEVLTARGFDVASDPRDRINPDALLD